MEHIADNVVAQWGAIGLLIAVLLTIIVALWKRDIKREEVLLTTIKEQHNNYQTMLVAYNEALVASTAATVELVTMTRIGK